MAFPEHELVSAEKFLEWIGTQEGRFELVDGHIVRMMAGAKQSHNVVSANILATLLPQARRAGCRTTSSAPAVRTGPGSMRYPDVAVDCGPSDPDALESVQPTMVVEVASPGTSAIDATDKLDEYRALESILLILFVDPDVISVKLYRRVGPSTWHVEKYDDPDQTIDLSEIGGVLSLQDIYESLSPLPRPRLRLVGQHAAGGP